MPDGRVRYDEIFVGRQKELQIFRDVVRAGSSCKILNIHTNNDGGIGKTQLLVHMQQSCADMAVVFAKKLIDFYHTESHSRRGILGQIVENFGGKHFPRFQQSVARYQDLNKIDASERKSLFGKIQEEFLEEYRAFAANIGMPIIIFFDTYEFIQEEATSQNQAGSGRLSDWIETQLFPQMIEQSPNTRLIVSGRQPLHHIDRACCPLQEINLDRFTPMETTEFWQECFAGQPLEHVLGPADFIDTLHKLTDGRPILAALFADWVNYEPNRLSPRELVNEIARRSGKPIPEVTIDHKRFFEKAVIQRIGLLKEPEDRAVTYMAVARRRMTPDLFAFLSGRGEEECRKILMERLKPLSFIKYKAPDVVLLHDQMYELVDEHWWRESDPDHSQRKALIQKIIRFYDKRINTEGALSDEDRAAYTPELLSYAFQADAVDGVLRFRDLFDQALEDGDADYCDLLLREAETYYRKHPESIPFPEFLRITQRRVRYLIDVEYTFQDAFELAEKILTTYQDTDSAWQEEAIHYRFLQAKGEALFFLGRYDEALSVFMEAKQGFYDCVEDALALRMNNWIGFTYYRMGHFSDAETWFIESSKGFSTLLEQRWWIKSSTAASPLLEKEREKRRYRHLIQGIQYAFGNLAILYRHTGQFARSIQYAEMLLDVVRYLPWNTREIARAQVTLIETLAFTGRTIDAHYHAEAVEKLLKEIYAVRWLQGRLRIAESWLAYRTKEVMDLLEYYRAEDIDKILRSPEFQKQRKSIEQARRFLLQAEKILEKIPVMQRELADACYALGELYMLTPSEDHWERSEGYFLKSLRHAEASHYTYRKIDTLESMVTLYYFWRGDPGLSEGVVHQQISESLETSKHKLDCLESIPYPDLLGKYRITLGDIEYDKALVLLEPEYLDSYALKNAVEMLENAFHYYTLAISKMRDFHRDRYYLALRIFLNRLHTLIDKVHLGEISAQILEYLDSLKSLWKISEISEITQIYTYARLRIDPQKSLSQIEELQQKIKTSLDTGEFGWALLLNYCLIGLYRALIPNEASDKSYHEHLLLELNQRSSYYGAIGNEYQAERNIRRARKDLDCWETPTDPFLKLALEGLTDSSAGASEYRRGEYGKLLEYYLRGELHQAQEDFDRQCFGARTRAMDLLDASERKLSQALNAWQDRLEHTTDTTGKTRLRVLIREYRKHLGEARFRKGELLMLNQDFGDGQSTQGALYFLKQAVEDARKAGDHYREQNAMQSYINAAYFSDQYGNEQCQAYLKQFDAWQKDGNASTYYSILGRLRITQGDEIFSRLFRWIPDSQKEGIQRQYARSTEEDVNQKELRKMLRYYVEACNFTARHYSGYFSTAVRILQQRMELIADKKALQILHEGLRSIWTSQPHLTDKTGELDTLVEFAKIRSMILEHANTH